MKVNRADLLRVLSVAAVGLTKRELIEQSHAFVFKDGYVYTFNGEVFTKAPSPLPEFEGAIPAEDFLKVLTKLPDDTVELEVGEEQIVLRAKRRKAGLQRLAEVQLPYDDVPQAKRWRDVPETLMGVLLQAARTCGRDETQAATTVVRVTPDSIEASDSYRIFFYESGTGFKEEVMLPATSIEAVGGVVVTQASERRGWVHFRTTEDHVISIRAASCKFPELRKLLDMPEAQEIKLPRNLSDILARAEVMQEAGLDAMVNLTLKEGKLVLRSSKETGWYEETKRVNYAGSEFSFRVHPKFLEDVLKKTNKVLISPTKLKLQAGEATFMVSLEVA